MKLVALIAVFLVLFYNIDPSWSLEPAFEGEGAGAPNINADADADANGYLAVLDGVRGTIEELIVKHDYLLKENKGEEAAMLREQRVSLVSTKKTL